MTTDPLMVAAGFGPFILSGDTNTRFHKDLRFDDRLRRYHLVGSRSTAMELQVDDQHWQLEAPWLVLLQPQCYTHFTLPPGADWSTLRFDLIHVPRRRVRKAPCSWMPLRDEPQPDSAAVFGHALPSVVPAEQRDAGLQMLDWCIARWWNDDVHLALANARLGRWLLDWVLRIARPALPGAGWYGRFVRLAQAEGLPYGRTVADLCRQLGIASRTLAAIFAREGHPSPGRVLRDLRMQKARGLLEGTSLSLDAISGQVGYRSLANFCQRFKAQHGCTPMQYRRRMRPPLSQ